jgi:hypothetical protein
MDPNSSNGSAQERGRSSGRQGGGVVDKASNTAINRESDVKKDMGPAVSNTYVADTMTVVNNYNF